jgi:hypothetical protein
VRLCQISRQSMGGMRRIGESNGLRTVKALQSRVCVSLILGFSTCWQDNNSWHRECEAASLHQFLILSDPTNRGTFWLTKR